MNKSESKYYNTALLMDQALLLLLEKKEYDFITVKEVCEKAGVNRSTFYLHYETMDDLLKECIELINKSFLSAFDKVIVYFTFTVVYTVKLIALLHLHKYLCITF